MIRVLVTGANGQLGRCLNKIANNYSVLEFSFKDFKQLDITNSERINSVFREESFDFCINCAAYTDVEQAEKNPEIAYKVNAEGPKNLALSCKENNVVLIHISTDYVFDGDKEGPYTVDDAPNPINEYGKSKLKGEKYVQEFLEKYLIIRTSWLYSEFGKNFYTTILRKAKAGEELRITDEQIGCPTDANHLARFILEGIDSDDLEYGIQHFTDGRIVTWYEFAESILKSHKLQEKVQLIRDRNYRTFAKRPKNSILY